jgi:hypothetical protein
MVSSSSRALNSIVPHSTRAHSLTLPKRFLSLCAPKAARTRTHKGVSVVVVSSTSSPSSEVSTGEEEEKCILWEAAKTSAAMLFVKDGEGKYTACNDALLNRIGFKKEDIIGKNDEDICKKIQNIADTDEEHKRFHAKHSYRGEAIFCIFLQISSSFFPMMSSFLKPILFNNASLHAVYFPSPSFTNNIAADVFAASHKIHFSSSSPVETSEEGEEVEDTTTTETPL